MLKTLLTIAISAFFILTLRAQQLPLFTQYQSSTGVLNPAALSQGYLYNEYNLDFGAAYRLQWAGIKNAPRTQSIHGSYFYEGNGINLLSGGYLLNDQTGPTGFTGAYGRFGVVLSEDPYWGGFSLALSFGLVQYRVNNSEIELLEKEDILANNDQSQLFPDAGFGLFYYKKMRSGWLDDSYLYGGISVPQLIGLDLSFESENGGYQIKRIQHFYGLAGLIKDFGDGNVLEPSIWMKYVDGAPIHADINLRYQLQGSFWLGAGGSTAGTMHLETGFILGENTGFFGDLRIGYSFDYSFQSFGPQVGSTHEFSVRYFLGE